jgi:hypothetical protein
MINSFVLPASQTGTSQAAKWPGRAAGSGARMATLGSATYAGVPVNGWAVPRSRPSSGEVIR